MKKRLLDIIGIGCGVFLLVVWIVMAVEARRPAVAGVKDSEIPAEAVTLSGTAAGRNGDVTVSVVADSGRIYRIEVTDHTETEGIGTLAVDGIPVSIFEAQDVRVDAVSGATITSDAIKAAVVDALSESALDPSVFGASKIKVEQVAEKVETGSGVKIMTAADWSEEYPEIYESWEMTKESDEVVDYLEQYPMLPVLYEDYGFSYSYGSARGHYYDVTDLLDTGRPHALANCFTCKTPDFTHMVNEMGDEAYSLAFEDVLQNINEPISCYTCHANTPGKLTVTHTYLTNAVGKDFESIDAADLSCGQCHVEYYFNPETKATTLPYHDLESMSPDAILAYYNETLLVDGMGFADYTNPRTGVRQIKVQHPELETFLGEGSPHRNTYTCADCHMGEARTATGTVYKNHNLTSPLDNEALLKNECSKCHADLASEVKAVQEEIERRTYAVGYELEHLTEKLADAVESGEYTEEELDPIRQTARNAQFYWDFVFVENSEGAHNPALDRECLDKAEALANEALLMLR